MEPKEVAERYNRAWGLEDPDEAQAVADVVSKRNAIVRRIREADDAIAHYLKVRGEALYELEVLDR